MFKRAIALVFLSYCTNRASHLENILQWLMQILKLCTYWEDWKERERRIEQGCAQNQFYIRSSVDCISKEKYHNKNNVKGKIRRRFWNIFPGMYAIYKTDKRDRATGLWAGKFRCITWDARGGVWWRSPPQTQPLCTSLTNILPNIFILRTWTDAFCSEVHSLGIENMPPGFRFPIIWRRTIWRTIE